MARSDIRGQGVRDMGQDGASKVRQASSDMAQRGLLDGREIATEAQLRGHSAGSLTKHDPEVQATIDRLVAFWPNDGSPIVLRRDPTESERNQLALRHRDLHTTLRPMSLEDKKRASRALATMFLGMPSMRNADSEATIAAFIYALSDMPVFAVLAACEDVMKNRVDEVDPDYPITAPRMVNLARRHTAPVEGERALIAKTLAAKFELVITPEERARLADAGKSWLDRSDPDARQLSGEVTKTEKSDKARKDLVAQIGQAAFDALPDA